MPQFVEGSEAFDTSGVVESSEVGLYGVFHSVFETSGVGIHGDSLQDLFFFDDPADCMEKEGVDAGCPVDLVRQMTDSLRGHLLIGRANYPRGCPCPRGYLLPQKLRDRQDAVVGSCFDIFQELRAAPAVKFWGVQVEEARLERTDSFEETLLQSAADAHDFAGCFHLGGQGIVRVRKFVKGETGHLGDYVIQRGLKGGRRICQRDLVEGHADSYFGGDAGDRVAAGL